MYNVSLFIFIFTFCLTSRISLAMLIAVDAIANNGDLSIAMDVTDLVADHLEQQVPVYYGRLSMWPVYGPC
jgi:hypothetical protein